MIHDVKQLIDDGAVIIDPYNEDQLNPNSYNLRITDHVYLVNNNMGYYIDPDREQNLEKIMLPAILRRGELYLSHTIEYTGCEGYVPMIEGRSSFARMGLFTHISAGFGDNGYSGVWTLELMPVMDILIRPGMEICQIFFTSTDTNRIYTGRYQNSLHAEGSKYHV